MLTYVLRHETVVQDYFSTTEWIIDRSVGIIPNLCITMMKTLSVDYKYKHGKHPKYLQQSNLVQIKL